VRNTRNGFTLIEFLILLLAIVALGIAGLAYQEAHHANAAGERLTAWARDDLTPFVRHGMEHFHPTDPPTDHIPPPPPPPDWEDPTP
jgi:hypothetical protein